MTDASADAALWAATVDRLHRELAALPADGRDWLAERVARIGALQVELDRLFREAGGPAACSVCLGGCCDRGRHHATLTNLLGYLLAGEDAPVPDFSRPCPFLGAQGCRLPAARRPFNCIVFLCEAVDGSLAPGGRDRIAGIEAELRRLYRELADRCPGAGLNGLLLAAARLGGRPLLTRCDRR